MDEKQYGKQGTKCIVANCDSYGVQRNSLSLFRFPRDKDMCTRWVERCGNFKLQEKLKKHGVELLRKHNRICSKHFISSDFRNPKLSSQGLKQGVMPSQHIFQPGTFGDIPQRTDRSTERNSNEKKNVLKLTSSETKSSKDKPNDQQAPNSTNCYTSLQGQPLAINPAVSAPGTTNNESVRRFSRRKDLLGMREILETSDDELEVTPISLVEKRSKNLGSIPTAKSTEFPDNLNTCAFLNCKSRNNRIPHLKFYPFPLNKNRAKLWAFNCHRPDLLDIDSQRLHIEYVLCSLHFEEHAVRDNLASSIKQHVSINSIPTLFDSNEKPETSTYSSKSMRASRILDEWSDANIVNETTTSEEFLNEISSSDQQDVYYEIVCADEIVSHPMFVPVKHTTATQTDPPWVVTSMVKDRSKSAICRLCAKLVPNTQLVHIFNQLSTSKDYLRIMNKFLPATKQVAENDCLPEWVCYNCCEILEYCKKAEQTFLAANRKLEKWGFVRSTKVQNLGISSKNASQTSWNHDPHFRTTDFRDPPRNTPTSKSTIPGNTEVITECNSSIKEVIEQECCDEVEHYDPLSEDKDHMIKGPREVDQCDSSCEQSESVGKKDVLKVPTKRKRVRVKRCSKSATRAKLNLIHNSHTTIRVTQDRKTILCERCDMSFDSIEKALTHRFKDHSSAEFAKQVKK